MKKYKIKVNGETYLVELEEIKTNEEEVTSSVVEPAPKLEGIEINAPLQGTVLQILKPKGSHVKRGEVLLTLEAMKLENEIVAPQDGEVLQVAVNVGNLVEQDQLLIVLG